MTNKIHFDGNEYDRIGLTICVAAILACAFADYMTYKNGNFNEDFFSLSMGLIGYVGIYSYSQIILDKNQFIRFAFYGLGIFLLCLVKQFLTIFNYLALFASTLPFLYVTYFRLLTFLFYKNSSSKLTIVFMSRMGSVDYKGKGNGYKPTIKERIFGLTLMWGFMLTLCGLLILRDKIVFGHTFLFDK